MIHSANLWRSRTQVHIEVECTPIPGAVFRIVDGSDVSVPFTVEGDRIKVTIDKRSNNVVLRLQGESKLLDFTFDDKRQLEGDVSLPVSKGSYSWGFYIPYCDFQSFDVKLVRVDGGNLEVQARDRSPFWTVDESTLYMREVAGKLRPCWLVKVCDTVGSVRYLTSSETNTWENVQGIAFRALVTGASRKLADARLEIFENDKVFEKAMYADF